MILILYKSLWWIILPWVLLFRWFKDRSSGKSTQYMFERLGFVKAATPHDIMLHAVSLGEVRAITPLVNALLGKYPDHSILVTTTTLTGRAQLESTFGRKISIAFLPHDIGYFIARFFKRVSPKVIMILETEIWPNLFVEASKLKVPLYIISACLSEKSYCGYLKIPKTMCHLLSSTTVMTQTQKDAERFSKLGVNDIKVMGNIKYNLKIPVDFTEKVTELKRCKSCLLITFASSHEGEEELFLSVIELLKSTCSNIQFAIAPRHPERFSDVEALIKLHNLSYQKRSQTSLGDFNCEVDIWLFDSIGELFYLYEISDIVVLGGSFVPIGGHNIIEPAILEKAIIIGEHYFTIEEMVNSFLEQEAIIVSSSRELAGKIGLCIEDHSIRRKMGRNAREAVMNNQNSLPLVMKEIGHILEGASRD